MTAASLTERLAGLRAALIFLAGGAIAIGVYSLIPRTPQDGLYAAIGLAGVAAILVGSQEVETERLAWRLFAVGLLSEVIADAIASFYEIHLGREPPLPSAADVFYLGGYPLLALGIFLMLRQRGSISARVGVLDTLIVFSAVATVQWMFLVEPYRHASLGTGARLTSMAYPSMDSLLLVGLAQLMVGAVRRTTAQWLLLASVALWIVGDEVFALSAGQYSAGGWLDSFWLGSYILWGGAALALRQRMTSIGRQERRIIPRLTRGRLLLLAGSLLAVPAALVVERLDNHRFHPIAAAVGCSVIAVLVLIRLAGLVRLVDRARIDERTARQFADAARERIEEQNTKLLELDVLKDDLLSSVSHELRTPLTSISGYVELLLEEVHDEEKRRHLEVVQRNTWRLLGLVSDLLFAARLQSGHFELRLAPVDVRVLVEQAADAARPHATAASVDVRVTAEDVPAISAEGDRLAQLLDNLVSNAIKFTPPGGEVVLSLAAVDGEVRIEVSDTGIGMREDELAEIFNRFYRASTASEAQIPGTGLGLFIAKAIVDAHGGRIDVRSSVGKGTVFSVRLPVGDA